MSANSFGQRFVLTTFGESHGTALGAVIDGMPAGVVWDEKVLRRELDRRRPGQSAVVTARAESDAPEVLSGVFENKTLGTPIAIIVRNHDARSDDYKIIAKTPRAGHADDVWKSKFGHSDPRGGGRSSGRETLCRVIGGACAQMMLKKAAPKLRMVGFARAIGPFELTDEELASKAIFSADDYIARFPSKKNQKKVEALLLEAKQKGLSYGGLAEIQIHGAPANLGQPVFHKLKSDLTAAFMSLGATSGVEIGAGFAAARAEGSVFHSLKSTSRAGSKKSLQAQEVSSHLTNRYGGIRGGISTGEPIIIRVAFKPTSSVLDTAKKGRHDPCIVPRAIPVLEAMANLVLADHYLWSLTDRL